jgi:hypothetical protein
MLKGPPRQEASSRTAYSRLLTNKQQTTVINLAYRVQNTVTEPQKRAQLELIDI